MKVKRSFFACMTVAVVFGSSVASVRADDIYPPPWQRGQPNTTFQDWTFSTIANPSPPDLGLYNPNGVPSATISGGSIWFQFYDGHQGVWALDHSSSIALFIPNTPPDETRHKDVWTQITWEPDLDSDTPVVMVNGIATTAQFSHPVGTGNWIQSVYETTLEFNPQSEQVIITGSYYLGQVVIDTICIPEPSSLALLAMGAISLLLYASRKRRLAA